MADNKPDEIEQVRRQEERRGRRRGAEHDPELLRKRFEVQEDMLEFINTGNEDGFKHLISERPESEHRQLLGLFRALVREHERQQRGKR